MLEYYNAGEKVNINIFKFENYEIDENIYKRIYKKSYQANELVSISDLTYVKLLHYDYNECVRIGELIIHKAILNETREIFKELFNNKYQIYSMKLIDDFWVDNDSIKSDRNSILNNNSSCFCYRNISNKNKLSNHAFGIVFDINPLENPYTPRMNDGRFNISDLTEYEKNILIKRDEKAKNNPHIIVLNDLICKIFDKYGYECGGIWPLKSPLLSCDWQHFEPNDNKFNIVMKRIDCIHNRKTK